MKNYFRFFLPALFGASVVIFFSLKSSEQKNIYDLIEIDNATRMTIYHLSDDNKKIYDELKFFTKENFDRIDTFPYSRRRDSLAYYNVFMQLKKHCDVLEQTIFEIKGELIAREEGIKNYMGDTLRFSLLKNPMDTKSVNTYMIDSDKVAERLVLQISQLEDFINSSHIFPVDQPRVRVTGKDYFENYSNVGNKWEVAMFRDRALIYSLLLLDSINLQVRVIENKALHKYMDSRWLYFLTNGCMNKK